MNTRDEVIKAMLRAWFEDDGEEYDACIPDMARVLAIAEPVIREWVEAEPHEFDYVNDCDDCHGTGRAKGTP